MFQSETYELIDALYYDNMASDTTNKYSTINCSLSYANNSITLTRTGDGECVVNYYVPDASVSKYLGQNVRFEFDVVSVDPQCIARIFQLINGSWQPVNGPATTSGNTAYVETLISNSATRVMFRVSANDIGTAGTCSFRNMKIYSI